MDYKCKKGGFIKSQIFCAIALLLMSSTKNVLCCHKFQFIEVNLNLLDVIESKGSLIYYYDILHQ